MTGEIDPEVAAFWRENYDLRYILRRDWKTLGPKLRGKVHLYCGTMDNFYLNNAVYLIEDFLTATCNLPFAGVVDYGDRAEHYWNGDHDRPNGHLPSALSSDVCRQDAPAHRTNGSSRVRPDKLAILIPLQPRYQPCSGWSHAARTSGNSQNLKGI